MTTRRDFLSGLGAGVALTTLPGLASAAKDRSPLAMPPLLDATGTGQFDLTAATGKVNFMGRSETTTWGFNQPYLGPTLRVSNNAETQAKVTNTLDEEISVHWHGLIVPGDVDGGPHQPVQPGTDWTPLLAINQPAATVWYHSHIHGKTAPQVYQGLAGVMQLTDGLDDSRGLPSDYGVDDLTLVLQDRRFDWRGRSVYSPSMREGVMGFAGDVMVVNGQVNGVGVVPKGIVRLRLLNGSNARIYSLAMADGRELHLIGTDSGLLDQPISLSVLTLAPGERAEVLVDFGDGQGGALVSAPDFNTGAAAGDTDATGNFVVLPFQVDATLPARIKALPTSVGGSRPDISSNGVVTRNLVLEMKMGPSMMFGGDERFSISGAPFKMEQINLSVPANTTERWVVAGQMLMHPFHVHGVAFQVVSENGKPPRAQNTGWKDTVLVNGQVEIVIPFTKTAAEATPYMYHCHILEHEDGGMMGQFTVG